MGTNISSLSISLSRKTPSCFSPSDISVICKARLLSEFKQLCLKMCHPCNIHLSYNQLKKFNEEYFRKKQMMIVLVEQSNVGYWAGEKIHFEQFKYSNEILPIDRKD